jgi:hypothetical protein
MMLSVHRLAQAKHDSAAQLPQHCEFNPCGLHVQQQQQLASWLLAPTHQACTHVHSSAYVFDRSKLHPWVISFNVLFQVGRLRMLTATLR